MSNQSFMQDPSCRRICATLGAYGYRTSVIQSREFLLSEAHRVFQVPLASPEAMIEAISSLPKQERKRRAMGGIFGNRKHNRSGGVESREAAAPRGKGDAADLLHQVVMAVINRGQGEILNDLPEVLAYFGSALPTMAEVMDVWPEMVEGEVRHDDLVYSFRVARPVKAQGSLSPDTRP